MAPRAEAWLARLHRAAAGPSTSGNAGETPARGSAGSEIQSDQGLNHPRSTPPFLTTEGSLVVATRTESGVALTSTDRVHE
jgi:hypothetical protein